MEDLVTDEDAEDAKEEQDDEADEQHAVTGSEVILGLGIEEGHVQVTVPTQHSGTSDRGTDTDLQREDDHCKANHGCNAHRHDHRVCVVEAGDHSHHVRQTESQDGLKTEATDMSAMTKALFSGLIFISPLCIYSYQTKI